MVRELKGTYLFYIAGRPRRSGTIRVRFNLKIARSHDSPLSLALASSHSFPRFNHMVSAQLRDTNQAADGGEEPILEQPEI